jgi:lipopolysaccharide export system permease protein
MVQILPVACLLGTLFVIGDLARNREYVAGLASGIPPERFLGGLLWAGLLISFLGLAFNETVVPPATRYATNVFQQKIRRLGDWRKTVLVNLFEAGAEGRMWSVRELDQSTGWINRVVVDTYQTGILSDQIDATRAFWKIDGWIFYDGVVRSYEKDGVSIKKITPFKEKFFPWVEKPSDFLIQEPQPEQMSYKTLKSHIRRLESLGVPTREWQVELGMKLAFPLACFVVTFLGVPLALRSRGNRAMGIAAATVIALIYMGFIQFGKALAQRLIPPLVGAWLGNVVFLFIGLYLWLRARRTV